MTQTPFTSTLACTQAAKQLDQLQQHKGDTILKLEAAVTRAFENASVFEPLHGES